MRCDVDVDQSGADMLFAVQVDAAELCLDEGAPSSVSVTLRPSVSIS